MRHWYRRSNFGADTDYACEPARVKKIAHLRRGAMTAAFFNAEEARVSSFVVKAAVFTPMKEGISVTSYQTSASITAIV